MAVERESGSSSLIDVLDRILDKGIVIDPWARISLGGIDLAGAEACVVVASMDIYRKFAGGAGSAGLVSHSLPAEVAPAAKVVKILPHRRPGRERGHR